jgi:hypothetical protein
MDARRATLLTGAVTAAIGIGLGGASAAAGRATEAWDVAAAAAPAPLHRGSRGPEVRALQQRLIVLGYLPAGTAKGSFGLHTWHAVVAFQGWQRLHRDGVVGPRTRAALSTAVRPRPWARLKRALELDLGRQVLLVVVRGRTVRAVHVSSASPGYFTPRGRFVVYRRERLSWSFPYGVWMPYALYFKGGYAVHGFSSVPASPKSHGCVRMPLHDAPFVFAKTPLHTPVLIR